MSEISSTYLSEANRALRAYKKLAEGALAQINDEEFLRKPDSESLSCALLVKHIAGNLVARSPTAIATRSSKTQTAPPATI